MTIFCSFCFSYLKPTNTYSTASILTISVTDNVSLNIASLDPTGTFAHSDTTTPNISIKTTNGSGYTLGIKASTSGANNNALINTNDNTKYIPSITTSGGITESTYSSDTSYNNTWAYRPSKLNSVANSNYLPTPNSNTNAVILDQTTTANPTTDNTYNIALGTRIDNNTIPGSYTNTFIITATVNPIPYTITYNKNTTDTVTNMPANESSSTYSDTVNISSTVPVRDGYDFKGWCTTQVADGASCSGTTYNPDGGGTNLTWTIDQTQPSASLTLYAVWEVAYNPCDDAVTLYELVACRSKGTQTEAQFREGITKGNSGVYEYDSSVFGTASDAANDHTIYYYRGILDNTVGSYGSDGDNAKYPNTVILSSASSKSNLTTSDTCWRIVRTTGSGGVKMIYQGKWTGSTCANVSANARVGTSAFDKTANSYGFSIVGVGYTYNANYKATTSAVSYGNLFGTNTSYSGNSTNSTIKTFIEDTWFGNIDSYASMLEQSAGYCNDRTIRTSNSSTSVIPNNDTIYPYSDEGNLPVHYFGAYVRNNTSSDKPTLTCPRDGADLYTTSSASNGNKQLGKPAALLTADEADFAGSGSSTSGGSAHVNSFLHYGSGFLLLSPSVRAGYSQATTYGSFAQLQRNSPTFSVGVRPAISLKPGSEAVSGSGTAADPWIVNP